MFIDLTRTVSKVMPVFPGDAPFQLETHTTVEDSVTHSHLTGGMHVGTHMDAPLHMVGGGKKISDIVVSACVARGHVIDARDLAEIDATELQGMRVAPGDCVLVYTGFDEHFGSPSFYANYPVFTTAFAEALALRKVSFVGMDPPSPDRHPYDVHRILLSRDILIIEGLVNLASLLPLPQFEVIALPAKFDAEAAPVRVIARAV